MTGAFIIRRRMDYYLCSAPWGWFLGLSKQTTQTFLSFLQSSIIGTA